MLTETSSIVLCLKPCPFPLSFVKILFHFPVPSSNKEKSLVPAPIHYKWGWMSWKSFTLAATMKYYDRTTMCWYYMTFIGSHVMSMKQPWSWGGIQQEREVACMSLELSLGVITHIKSLTWKSHKSHWKVEIHISPKMWGTMHCHFYLIRKLTMWETSFYSGRYSIFINAGWPWHTENRQFSYQFLDRENIGNLSCNTFLCKEVVEAIYKLKWCYFFPLKNTDKL